MNAVRIQHKGIEGTALVSERAFMRVHQAAGWELADQPAPQPADDPPDTGRPQRNDSTDTWRTYAEQRGMPGEQADQFGRDDLIAYFDNLDTTQEP